MMSTSIQRQEKSWDSKRSLRFVYRELFEEIKKRVLPGDVLEIGSGTGRLKEFFGEVVTTVDNDPESNADMICDAGNLPLEDSQYENIVAVNVFHHIRYPYDFLEEMSRVLVPKGRLLFVEPNMGFLNYPIFRFLHHEVCKKDLKVPDDLVENRFFGDGNSYYGTWFFIDNWERTENEISFFRLVQKEYLGSTLDFINGGFCHPSLLPDSWCLWLYQLRRKLPRVPLDASRYLLVLENQKCG